MERTATQGQAAQQQKYLPILQECRDRSLISLGDYLGEMFDHVEQALLDFMDKAETNQSQFQFIDAISVAKARREAVEQSFREEISRGFSEFSKNSPITYPLPLLESQQQGSEGLSLVDDSELDQRLSLQKMIEKARGTAFQQLYALRQRLAMVRGGQKLEEQDIPAGPPHIASAFQIGAAEFDFETNILLIIYALFDKYVMGQVDHLYEEFNERLVAAGVFPNLKLEAPSNPYATPESDQGAQTADEGQPDGEQSLTEDGFPAGATDLSLGEEIFHSIRDLLASRRQQDARYAQHPDIHPGAGAGTRPMVDTPALVSAIGDLQPSQSASFLPDMSPGVDLPASVDVDVVMLEQVRQRLIDEREKLFQGVDRNEIPSADLDTIELVGMLFEHVLNEEDLPNIAKALISHLHTPYLKVAILDHHFLIDSRHIARRLLNLMVDAGLEWIEEEDLRRGIYYPMQECVNQILAEFQDNLELFDSVYDKLTKQVEHLEQKAKVVEARAREAAKGRERLENARIRAHRIIQEHIGERRFHPAIERFLNHGWLDKMILMMLRDPEIENSAEWQQVVDVIDDIAWAQGAKTDRSIRDQLRPKLPDLRKRIESGLNAMGDFHHPDLENLFQILSSYLETKPAEAMDELVAVTEPPVDRVAPAERVPVQKESQAKPITRQEQAMVETLRKAKFGTWFELEDDNQKLHRLKLSWFSPVTQKYMFVDKSGIQALVTPIEILAKQMCNGRAKILKQPTVPFVDRTLKTVLDMLQKTFNR